MLPSFTCCPATIVGAGLAGLACAIVLARAGRPGIVREGHKTVGNRFHGDFQGLENWSDGQDVLDELRAGKQPKTGSQLERYTCEPLGGLTSLTHQEELRAQKVSEKGDN